MELVLTIKLEQEEKRQETYEESDRVMMGRCASNCSVVHLEV